MVAIKGVKRPDMNGNKFWELRSKHGRDKLFATPELLWEATGEFFQWILDNPLEETDFRGKDADRVILPHIRPFTMQGLCSYLDCSTSYFRTFKSTLLKKDDKLSKDFLSVLTRIEETVYRQKFEGAATGFYNANIIARDLGLTDKKDLTSAGESLNISVNVQDQKLKDKLDKE